MNPPKLFSALPENSPSKPNQMQNVLEFINERESDAYTASWRFLVRFFCFATNRIELISY